tara:strand:- start:3206 stop:3484 length:279 start_codon:yes stop_codon:yes gene_type:complete
MSDKIEKMTKCEDCGDSYSTVGWVSDECPFCKVSEIEVDRDLMSEELRESLSITKDLRSRMENLREILTTGTLYSYDSVERMRDLSSSFYKK